jgi:hypothetical protein
MQDVPVYAMFILLGVLGDFSPEWASGPEVGSQNGRGYP